jgi:protoheme IX farnesyltransferase
LLFLIIFFWTPPHFWALSLLRADDYARAGVPMLPVVAGPAETRRQILIYSLALLPIGATPWLLGYAGIASGASALVAGALMLRLAWRVWYQREGRAARWAAQRLFAFSIVYLFVVFGALLAEALIVRYLGAW